jgi:peptide/nickel transport system substrate-binding protein
LRSARPPFPAFSAAPPTRPRHLLVALTGATALATGLLAASAASAESILTMHIGEQTSCVQNFNSFDLGGRRQSTMDFVYEPLVISTTLTAASRSNDWRRPTSFSDDLKSITYTLRDGVKWSDGQKLTSTEMKYTLELNLKNPAVDTVGIGESVASVEAPSRAEVKINLKRVDTHFPELASDF